MNFAKATLTKIVFLAPVVDAPSLALPYKPGSGILDFTRMLWCVALAWDVDVVDWQPTLTWIVHGRHWRHVCTGAGSTCIHSMDALVGIVSVVKMILYMDALQARML